MQGINKPYYRNLSKQLQTIVARKQSALLFGPRQTGKTTLVNAAISNDNDHLIYDLGNPSVKLDIEKDPSSIIRTLEAKKTSGYVVVDEAQKVPAIFDTAQYCIDKELASFILTGSSARKLKRKGSNLLPGRVKSLRLDPLSWNEFGWLKESYLPDLKQNNINQIERYSFLDSLVYGALPGIVKQHDLNDRRDFLKSYTHIYLEEEIRAEALSRNIGAFSRFLELAAVESGTSPNMSKLAMESGVSAPAIKEFYNILVDTLVVEKIEPYQKNSRKRLISSPRYYFFDIGVRNVLARLPLTEEILNIQKGSLFEHAVILEIIRRARALNLDYHVNYWRTRAGAEVDCVIDTGTKVIPIEIKASTHSSRSDIKGLLAFMNDYPDICKKGYIINQGKLPEKITDNILSIPWQYL